MKSQDILVLLKIFLSSPDKYPIAWLAYNLFMSKSEVHASIKRLKVSGLMRERPAFKSAVPNIEAMEEFLIHGLKYVFPAEEGKEMRGIPTAHSALPLSELIIAEERDTYVWPCEVGNVRGKSILPLYSSVPRAVEGDKKLYELLVLLDGIRTGRTREAAVSVEELTKRLKAGSEKFKNAY